jgi:VWFA-related protein
MRDRRPNLTLFLALAALATAAPPLAAQPSQQPATKPAESAQPSPAADQAPAESDDQVTDQFFESIEVNVVNVDVYVTDKKGQRVRGLKKDDFELFEDGKPVAISNFYAVENGSPIEGATPPVSAAEAAPPAPAPRPPGIAPEVPEDQRLHLVVYVDNWNIKPFDRNRVFTGVREFLRTRLSRDDRVMLMTYDREPHVRRSFTSDADAIASALFEVEKLSANGSRQDSERRDALRDVRDSNDSAEAITKARNYASSVFNDLSFSIDSLRDLVSSLAGMPGRKAILYVSDGLPLVAGEDVFHAIQDKYTDATAAILESRQYDASRRFKELVASANANRISFYTLDAAGLRTPTSVTAEEQSPVSSAFVDSVYFGNVQGSLRMLADDTGGIAILNTNDPTKMLREVGDDLGNYYSLGYSPAHSGDGRYYKIEVKVKGRKDLVVRNREGYRDKSAETRMSDGVMSSLFFDVESNPMGIVLQRGEEALRDDGYYTVPVKIRIPIGKLVLVPQGDKHVAKVRVFVAAMDEKGRLSEVQQQAVPIEIPNADVERASQEAFVYTVSLMMRKGPQKLAVGVRDDLAQASSFTVRTMDIGAG